MTDKTNSRQDLGSVVTLVNELTSLVERSDYVLDEATFAGILKLFTLIEEDQTSRIHLRVVSPEFGEPEFLRSLASNGEPVWPPEALVNQIQKQLHLHPTFARWMCEVQTPGQGPITFLIARWLCHLAGFRHGTVQLFIELPDRDGTTLLQVRGAKKTDAPGCYDLPVAGHISRLDNPLESLRRESIEEMALNLDMVDHLSFLGAYDFVDHERRSHLTNMEYRYVYACRLNAAPWQSLQPDPEEVASISIFSYDEIENLLTTFPERFASGIKSSFPLYSNTLRNRNPAA
jgi:isopentenyldiphosphate isomerase